MSQSRIMPGFCPTISFTVFYLSLVVLIPLSTLVFKSGFKPAGIVVALIFISIPFVVRTVEPVLQEFDSRMEEAASSLGATRWQVFTKII
jgi:ABC-type sulfate transport system permease component